MTDQNPTYRIWFRGKPGGRVPQYRDLRFPTPEAAEEWAITAFRIYNTAHPELGTFNRISIHTIDAGTVATEPIRGVIFHGR